MCSIFNIVVFDYLLTLWLLVNRNISFVFMFARDLKRIMSVGSTPNFPFPFQQAYADILLA